MVLVLTSAMRRSAALVASWRMLASSGSQLDCGALIGGAVDATHPPARPLWSLAAAQECGCRPAPSHSRLQQQWQQQWSTGASCSSSSSSSSSLLDVAVLNRAFSSSSGTSEQAPPATQQRQQQPPSISSGSGGGAINGRITAAFHRVGWSREEVLNIPNALSMARLLSGPLIASWILDGQWSIALPALAASGASDWLDGYVAKRWSRPSVIGSYLDPLADKVLVCSVVGALGWSGVLSAPIVAIILGRDVLLVAGVFAARAHSLGWRWPGAAEFFRVATPQPQAQQQQGAAWSSSSANSGASSVGSSDGSSGVQAAPFVQPLYISKVNTAFQLGLVAACIGKAWLGWPGEDVVWWASAATAGTTVASTMAYVRGYMQGKILAGPAAAAAASTAKQ